MSNTNQEEINSARSEIAEANSRIAECQRTINSCRGKISRLKAAKDSMVSQKDGVQEMKRMARNNHGDIDDWKGKKQQEYEKLVEDGLLTGYGDYEEQTDRVLDEINNEITRLENQINDQDGLVGWLKSKVNSLGNYIENLFN